MTVIELSKNETEMNCEERIRKFVEENRFEWSPEHCREELFTNESWKSTMASVRRQFNLLFLQHPFFWEMNANLKYRFFDRNFGGQNFSSF